ncbi:cysteine hydrolase family protein [Loigolactobacillus coryniformis]|uniref:Isochorismatase n=1 Tax=Loigolactobacillus coryniformis subsp. torquens DSM 20004 = KCTC 3535 TaxID=1423822 RepID=A0A2D1KLI8_9LACO|nr:isochorismatase family cysteine hydrolase [Loigolactobacillus coryniformis]ATO42993.1 isochorismatase [Loigolactobacillus coryniformis subsp. torquens DSM 20004 = KCTC 3535]KRK84802.1 pyrazinamidase nicotinamidase [Loigolactobacillus coryniformis subsp. torquens DSM 20004 = KCTC 3535]
MANNTALLIIDYTNDFVADNGALTAGKPAQVIESAIVALADQFITRNDWVFLPTDVHKPHDPYHPETKLFPPHNIADSWGRELYGQLASWYTTNQKLTKVIQFAKTRYSAFAGTDLDLRLRERQIDTLHLTGVCTDICVLHTAISAYNLGYHLVINRGAVATFNPQGQEWALDHFANVLGAKIID